MANDSVGTIAGTGSIAIITGKPTAYTADNLAADAVDSSELKTTLLLHQKWKTKYYIS